MMEAYRVRVMMAEDVECCDVMQVLAGSPDEAERAVRSKVAASARVEADGAPLSVDQAKQAGVISGKILLS